MANAGMTPYGPVGSNPYARIELVRPVQRRQADQNAQKEISERAPQSPARTPDSRAATGRLVDLSI